MFKYLGSDTIFIMNAKFHSRNNSILTLVAHVEVRIPRDGEKMTKQRGARAENQRQLKLMDTCKPPNHKLIEHSTFI